MSDSLYSRITKQKLADVFSRTIYTVDGLWFLAVENKYGHEAAVELDIEVWEKMGPIQARRTVNNFVPKDDNPIRTLVRALLADSVLRITQPEVTIVSNNKAILRCTDCPPQRARVRDGKGEFNCRPVDLAFFKSYAEAIAPEIKVTCLVSPPDEHPPEYWCEWQFEI